MRGTHHILNNRCYLKNIALIQIDSDISDGGCHVHASAHQQRRCYVMQGMPLIQEVRTDTICKKIL
jgi:hypothetical protein